MEGSIVVADAGDGVAVITLSAPERRNAVTMEMQAGLDAALVQADADDVRAIVLTGAGDRAFSAGYDLAEMDGWSADALLLGLLERERWIWRFSTQPIPIVAAVGGVAYGWGAITATACDLRIGSADSVIRFSSARFGGANATWTLPQLIGRGRAAELLMTARPVPAEEAERIGLLNRVAAEGEDLLDVALESARLIAANPANGIRAIKRLLREHDGRSFHDRFIAENLVMRTELRPHAAPPLPANRSVNDR
jgi:2-(1,2-epoxy-1,2-dihydrophenyl)acetyl-CoA isomerase